MISSTVVGTYAAALVLAGYTASDTDRRLLSIRGFAVRCFLAALSLLLLQHSGLAEDSVCPIATDLSPASNSDTLVVPKYASNRPLIANDYIVIEYNAEHDKGSWSDYKHTLDSRTLPNRTYQLDTLDSFLPVVYTKEKVAVRICGFHFTDVVSVTTSVNGVPEGVADIRGVAPVTPPASLSNSFDTLQSGVPTGGTTLLPGLGLGAPAQLPSLAVSGIVLGSLGAEDQTPGKFPSYSPATATASGKQVALLFYSMARNATEMSRLIDRTMGEPYPTQDSKISEEVKKYLNTLDQAKKDEILDESKSAPGSVKGVRYILALVLSRVRSDDSSPTYKTNSVAFDSDMISIQNVNAQITTLANSLSSQAFASNALTLLNNYSALTGILDLAKLVVAQTNCQPYPSALQPANPSALSKDDLNKLKLNDFANWTATQLVSLSSAQIGWIADPTLQRQIRSIRQALSDAGVTTTSSANDKPLCSAFEKQKLTDFWKSYNTQIDYLIVQSTAEDFRCKLKDSEITVKTADDYEGFAGCKLIQLNAHIDTLREGLKDIDLKTTELYDRMNEWNRASSIEHTDALQPLPQNADVKISIVVQHGYTPFTLTNANGTITPAVTANVVPTAPGTASTSSPAHSRRIVHLQVHRLANFNLVGGPLLIHIPTASFGVQASPTYAVASSSSPTGYAGTCGGMTVPVPVSASQSTTSPVSYTCIIQTQHTEWQVEGMAGLTWFPIGHDYYPHKLGYLNSGRNLIPSLLLATSVTSLGNSMGGINWEPIGGVDIYAGVASAHRSALPSGVAVNTAALPGTTITPVTQEHAGFAIGVGLDLNSIIAIFSFKGSSAGLP